MGGSPKKSFRRQFALSGVVRANVRTPGAEEATSIHLAAEGTLY